MVYFGTIGQLYKTTSFLVVSSSFLYSEMRKSGGNNEETTSLVVLYNYQTIRHEIRVTTLWLKQPICFFSVISMMVDLSISKANTLWKGLKCLIP